MILGFTLTMPNVGAWNGKWAGEKNIYFRKRNVPKQQAIKLLGENECMNFHYSWNDGWGANVNVRIMDAKEANKLQNHSRGFCGYDWMIDSILEHGEIRKRTIKRTT